MARGTYKDVKFVPGKIEQLKNEERTWSAHTHVAPGDIVPSGASDDRGILTIFVQEQSLLLYSLGRRRVFNQFDGDYIDPMPKPRKKQ